jgi:hypothetical protein
MFTRGDRRKDSCSQWLIGKQAGSILRLGGVTGFTGWTLDETQLVAPSRVPDGLVKVTFTDRPEPVPYLLEIESYSNTDADRQVFEDLLLARLDRGVIPEAICVVLCPKGKVRVRGEFTGTSTQGTSSITARWRVIELWTLRADELLAQNDIGLIPWVPLTQIEGPAEPVLQECRERIERDAPANQRKSFCAITEILGRMIHPRGLLESIFLGGPIMIDSPAFADAEARCAHRNIIMLLNKRLGTVPVDLQTSIRKIYNLDSLDTLVLESTDCTDFDSYRSLVSTLPQE